jgi:hypothetical protein
MTEELTVQVVERTIMSQVDPRAPNIPPYAPPPTTASYVQLPPQSTVQLAHATSDAVISGLAKSPYLLGVVVLVAIGVGAAIYFLQILITGQATHLASLLSVQQKQQTELVTLHKQEFDALLEMANRLATPIPSSIIQGPPPPPPRSPR